METIVKVIRQRDYDRNVFITYHNNEIVGLNFHQGCDEILWDYKTSCPALYDIYERLNSKNHIKSEEDRINRAIDLFCDAFIFQNENSYEIPKGQLALIQKALNFYVYMHEFNKFNHLPTESSNYEIFDMNQLSAMMDYSISIKIDDESKNKFAFKHGMDFPYYVEQ